MWMLQYTINYIYSKIRWTEREIRHYYTIVVTPELETKHRKYRSYEEKVESTRRCLRLQKKKFEESEYWDPKKKRRLVRFKVYYTARRRIPILPRYREIYNELREKIMEVWKRTPYAAHYVDRAPSEFG